MRLLGLLERWWFAEAPASRLALLRILLGVYTLFYVSGSYSILTSIGYTDPSLFEPVGLARLLSQPGPPAAFHGLVVLTLLTNIAFILGAGHRLTGPLFSVLLLAVLSYRNSWAMIYHSANLVVFHALILGFTPAADALSLDALRRKRSDEPELWLRGRDPTGDWRYGWPIQLMCAVTVTAYFLSGVAKVAGPLGWAWAKGESMRAQVAIDGLRKELLGSQASPLLYRLYDNLLLFTLLGIGTLVLELGAPLALAHKRLKLLWAPALFLMHWGIYALMGITFRYQLCGIAFASFFELERIPELFSRKSERAEDAGAATAAANDA